MSEFRQLHRPGDPFVLANAWDRGSARVLAALGADAIGTTSAGHAFTLGRPDGGGVGRDELLEHAADLVEATPLPVSADMENGYGHDPGVVAESIRVAGAVGLAGASIEDTAWPDSAPYEFDAAVARVAAAASAARSLEADFVLVARADGVLNGHYRLDEAIRRIKAFESVGADCVYVPLLPDLHAVEQVVQAVSVPVNVLVVGALTTLRRSAFAQAGVARLSLGSGLARLTHQALMTSAAEVLDSGDFSSLAHGAGGQTIDELLGRGAVGGRGD